MPRINTYPLSSKDTLPDGAVSLRCHDCGHEYRANRPEYICPVCEGDVGLAPMPRTALA